MLLTAKILGTARQSNDPMALTESQYIATQCTVQSLHIHRIILYSNTIHSGKSAYSILQHTQNIVAVN